MGAISGYLCIWLLKLKIDYFCFHNTSWLKKIVSLLEHLVPSRIYNRDSFILSVDEEYSSWLPDNQSLLKNLESLRYTSYWTTRDHKRIMDVSQVFPK